MSTTDKHLAFLQAAPQEAVSIALDHVTLLGELVQKAQATALRFSDLDPGTIQSRRDEAIGKLRQETASHLDALKQRAETSRQAIEFAANPPVPMDVAGQTLHELQRARISRTLDRGSTVDQLAAAAGDRATLAALRAEVATLNLDADQVDSANRTIDQAEAPLLSDAERSARDARAEVATGWPKLETTLAHTRAFAESDGREGGPWVSDWNGATISLQPDVYPAPIPSPAGSTA